jgi:ABC-type branched-subunit amino acid transport system substrate-binding protein
VFAQNEVAERLHREVPDRPYVSLIYFAGLTTNESAPATEHSVAEELEGMVIRQREQNTPTSVVEPLLRVVVANGGTGMVAAPEVVRDELVPLAESDQSILGVVGLDRSVAETEKSITELGRHGIPVLGSTLTSVGLGDLSPTYFQLVPDNARQAELLSEYARRLGVSRVTIYHPPVNGPNSYVNTLVRVMRERLDGDGVEVAVDGWQRSANELTPLCADATDRRDEIAFYAGREVDFGDFLRTVRRNCAEPEKLPHIVADDAVSRFVAHPPGRRLNELNGVTISYVGMGGLVVLAGERCVKGQPGSLRGGGPALDAFCAGYRELREELNTLPPEDRPIASWPGERVGGLYDAAGLFVEAVRLLQSRPGGTAPHRVGVAMMFREMTFQGATGTISFRASRIGNNRNLAILTIANVRELDGPDGVPKCALMIGTLYSDQQPTDAATGCPVGP